MKTFMKHIPIFLLFSFVLISCNSTVDGDKYWKRNSSEQDSVVNSNENLSTEEKELKLIKSIQDELTILEKGIDYSQYRGSIS